MGDGGASFCEMGSAAGGGAGTDGMRGGREGRGAEDSIASGEVPPKGLAECPRQCPGDAGGRESDVWGRESSTRGGVTQGQPPGLRDAT